MHIERHKEVREALVELREILNAHGEDNWKRGIDAAIGELSSDPDGFDNAKSIFKTMTTGGRGLCEYYVWDNDEKNRIDINNKIESLRLKVWSLFDL